MEMTKSEQQWERTNVTNLLRNRQSGKYYARVKVNGKQKWRALKSEIFSVTKLRLADLEKTMRAQGTAARGETAPGSRFRNDRSAIYRRFFGSGE